MDDKLFQLYTLAIMNYEKKFKDRVNDIEELYPRKWDSNINYKTKIKIISESIKDDKLIKDTNLYQEQINDVKNIKR